MLPSSRPGAAPFSACAGFAAFHARIFLCQNKPSDIFAALFIPRQAVRSRAALLPERGIIADFGMQEMSGTHLETNFSGTKRSYGAARRSSQTGTQSTKQEGRTNNSAALSRRRRRRARALPFHSLVESERLLPGWFSFLPLSKGPGLLPGNL